MIIFLVERLSTDYNVWNKKVTLTMYGSVNEKKMFSYLFKKHATPWINYDGWKLIKNRPPEFLRFVYRQMS